MMDDTPEPQTPPTMTLDEIAALLETCARTAEVLAEREQRTGHVGWQYAVHRHREHAAQCRLAASQLATLEPPRGCVFVAVQREFLPKLGQWSEPVRMKVVRTDGRVAELLLTPPDRADLTRVNP